MSTLIESLLYQNEGTALDFKRDQYPFVKATEEQKSELLKDILAFANSWRQTEAYIVIGVEEVKGGRSIPWGTEDHFDDAQIQQFINSKTNRQVKFAYEVHLFEGNKIGVIRIPQQERPIYATKNYGKVKKEVVYYRSNSSTAIATPDDIARMGRDSVPKSITPVIDLQFADLQKRQKLGNHINIFSIYYSQPKHPLADYSIQPARYKVGSYDSLLSGMRPVNSHYWRDKEEYLRLNNLLKPVALIAYNQSNTLAENVRVELINNSFNQIKVSDELPIKPSTSPILRKISFKSILQKSPIDITYHGDTWTLSINLGNIQPKSSVWLSEPFFLGAIKQEQFEAEAVIYADNIPDPQQVNLKIDFTVENKSTLTIDDLDNMPPFDN
ncbi:MAG: ATP-binding protein [Cyanobacteria bacterium J06621_8]